MTEADGDTTPEMREAYRRVELDPPTLRKADVEGLTGVAHEQSVRWWRAMGFPEVPDDEPAFRDNDVAMVRRLADLLDAELVDEEGVLRLARLMGASFSRLVEAQLEVVDDVLLDQPAGADTRADVVELLESTMTYVWRRHLLAAISQRLSFDDADEQAVGFADLSGFSRISKNAGTEVITEIIERFETVAFDVVSGHEGRVVKLIGDEVMFVTRTLDDAISIGADIITRLEPVDIMPPVHCGIAWGPTVTIGGDVFGPTVNLASRLTDVAKRGTIVVPQTARDHMATRDDLDVRRVRRPYDLQGVGRTSVLAIRPAQLTERPSPAE